MYYSKFLGVHYARCFPLSSDKWGGKEDPLKFVVNKFKKQIILCNLNLRGRRGIP